MGAYKDNKTRNQFWIPEMISDKHFILMNPDTGKCISIMGSSGAGISNIKINECNKDDQKQLFSLQTPKEENKKEIPDDHFFDFVGPHGLCVKGSTNGKRLTQKKCSGDKDSQWMFIPYNGAYIIKNKDGLVLDNSGYRKNNGNPIIAYKDNKTRNQFWIPEMISDKHFILMNPDTGKCISIMGSSGAGISNIKINECNKDDQKQLFSLQTPKEENKKEIPDDHFFDFVGPHG